MKHHCLRHPAIYGSSDPGWWHDEEPCKCSCDPCQDYKRINLLPDVTLEELDQVSQWLETATPGPWQDTQIPGWGPEKFILTLSQQSQPQWYQVVAHLGNASFVTGSFIAWCRDGVPRLLRKIRQLEDELKKYEGR